MVALFFGINAVLQKERNKVSLGAQQGVESRKFADDHLKVIEDVATTDHTSFGLVDGWVMLDEPRAETLGLGAEVEVRNDELGCSIVHGWIDSEKLKVNQQGVELKEDRRIMFF